MSRYNARINYYLTTDEGRIVKRAVQNTRQREASCLLEDRILRQIRGVKLPTTGLRSDNTRNRH